MKTKLLILLLLNSTISADCFDFDYNIYAFVTEISYDCSGWCSCPEKQVNGIYRLTPCGESLNIWTFTLYPKQITYIIDGENAGVTYKIYYNLPCPCTVFNSNTEHTCQHTFSNDWYGTYHGGIVRIGYFGIAGTPEWDYILEGSPDYDYYSNSCDFDKNGIVNFYDLSFMVKDWKFDCNDPNISSDPDRNCLYGTNVSGNSFVNEEDLNTLLESWLIE